MLTGRIGAKAFALQQSYILQLSPKESQVRFLNEAWGIKNPPGSYWTVRRIF